MLPQTEPPSDNVECSVSNSTKTVSLGLVLRQRREQKNLSIAEVSNIIKIRKHFIDAIETDNFEKLPTGVYKIAFIRCYCQFLEMEPKTIQSFLQSLEDLDLKKPSLKLHFQNASPPPYLSLWIVLISLLISIVFTGYFYYRQKHGNHTLALITKNHSSPKADISEQSPPLITPTALDAIKITFFALEPTWIRLTDSDQNILATCLLGPGESYQMIPKEDIYLTTGSTTALEVYKGFQKISLPHSQNTLNTVSEDKEILENFLLYAKK